MIFTWSDALDYFNSQTFYLFLYQFSCKKTRIPYLILATRILRSLLESNVIIREINKAGTLSRYHHIDQSKAIGIMNSGSR